MLERLIALFRKPRDPEVGVVGLPVEVNPATGIRADRNKIRIARLQEALDSETDKKRRASLEDELARRIRFGR